MNTMSGNDPLLVRATSDGADRLVAADDLLARLQMRCGGEFPGTIAVPALLEAVRSSREFGLRLARPIMAQDGSNTVRAWVEIQPRGEDNEGCDIVARHWQVSPLSAEDTVDVESRRADIDRGLAEFFARLDAGQRVLAAQCDAADLRKLVIAMEQGVGRAWTDFVSIEGAHHRLPMHWRLLDGARVTVPGSDRQWRAALHPQTGADGTPSGFDLLLVAHEGLSEASLIQAPPQTSLRLIGEDVAPVLRQPIKRIIANAETIRTRLAGPIAEEYAGYAADIAAAGEHLLALLDDLGDLEVVEADDFSTQAESVDLAEVARKAAGILGVRARERGIVLEAPLIGTRMPVIGEFRRILQILLNLVNNAIRYTPENTRVVLAVSGDGERSRISITDEGAGLAEQDRARVFEKFERLGRSGDGGSGLGLYISRRLARAMGGELHVENAPAGGARFVLELPAEQG